MYDYCVLFVGSGCSALAIVRNHSRTPYFNVNHRESAHLRQFEQLSPLHLLLLGHLLFVFTSFLQRLRCEVASLAFYSRATCKRRRIVECTISLAPFVSKSSELRSTFSRIRRSEPVITLLVNITPI
jgi:hypothetical protein